jgi:hypothetical protein
MIQSICQIGPDVAQIKLIEGFKHQFSEGDHVMLQEVKGMKSIDRVESEGGLES